MLDATQELRRWLLHGSFVTLLGRISFGAFAILQNAVLARLLDGTDFGAFLLTQSVILPAMLVSLFGTDLLAIAWLGTERNLASVLLSGSAVVTAGSLLTGFAVALSLTALSHTTNSTWGIVAEWRWLIILLVLLSAAQTYLAAVFRGLRSIGKATLVSGVLSSFLLLTICFTAYGRGLYLSAYTVIVLQTATLAVSVAYGIIDLGRMLYGAPVPLAQRLRDALRNIWTTGGPLMLTQLLAFIVTQSDIWIVSSFASPYAVAGYGLAARLAQLVSLPHLVLNGVLPPLMATWISSQQYDRLNQVIGTAVEVALALAICLALFYVVAGRLILQILFNGYGAWFEVLLILTLGNVANVAAGPCSQMLIMAGQGKTLLVITAITCVFCCSLGALAGKFLGPIGTAVVFAAGLTLQGIVSARWTQKHTSICTYPTRIGKLLGLLRS